jgi:FkbM family methyltransferase
MGGLERTVIDQLVLPGMHVIDVGANIGLYSIYFHERVGESGKVTALEPVPELRAALEKSLAQNQIRNVDVLACGAGAAEGNLVLSLDPWNSGNNWVETKRAETTRPQISVSLRRLDALGLEPAPDFVKIDVQGWEVQVLQGMAGWVAKGVRPIILCEVSEGSLRAAQTSTQALVGTLLDFGYEIFLPRRERARLNLVPMTRAELDEHAARHSYFDVVARRAK